MEDLQLSQQDILSKLATIEEYVRREHYRFYEPTETFDSNDMTSVQKEAVRMLEFAGLNNYTVVITYVSMYGNTGGKIDLDNSQEVFIEINKKYKGNNDKTLAILSHEICHKILFVNKLYSPVPLENEILTDLATVYIGFGKLSLNGCYDRQVIRDIDFQLDKIQINTTTNRETVGYLSLAQFATAYNMVCGCYGIKKSEKMKGLSSFASKQVASTSLYYSVSPVSTSMMKKKLKQLQRVDSRMMNSVVMIEELMFRLRKEIQQHHERYWQDFIGSFNLEENCDITSNPLRANEMLTRHQFSHNDLKELGDIMQRFIRSMVKNNHQHCDFRNIEERLFDIECPHCGYKKKHALNEHGEFFRKCPQCDYLFVWDGQKHHTDKIDGGTFLRRLAGLVKGNRDAKNI